MKTRISVWLIICFFCLGCVFDKTTVIKLEPYTDQKATIAVVEVADFVKSEWWTKEIGNGIADMLAVSLRDTGRFNVLPKIKADIIILCGVTKYLPRGYFEAAVQLIDSNTGEMIVNEEVSSYQSPEDKSGLYIITASFPSALSEWSRTPRESALRILLGRIVGMAVEKTPSRYFRHKS